MDSHGDDDSKRLRFFVGVVVAANGAGDGAASATGSGLSCFGDGGADDVGVMDDDDDDDDDVDDGPSASSLWRRAQMRWKKILRLP